MVGIARVGPSKSEQVSFPFVCVRSKLKTKESC